MCGCTRQGLKIIPCSSHQGHISPPKRITIRALEQQHIQNEHANIHKSDWKNSIITTQCIHMNTQTYTKVAGKILSYMSYWSKTLFTSEVKLLFARYRRNAVCVREGASDTTPQNIFKISLNPSAAGKCAPILPRRRAVISAV